MCVWKANKDTGFRQLMVTCRVFEFEVHRAAFYGCKTKVISIYFYLLNCLCVVWRVCAIE